MQLAIISAMDTTRKINLNTLKTEVEQAGGEVKGTTFPVTITKGMVAIEVSEYGYNGTSPIIEYKLTKTNGTKINESDTLSEDSIVINISISNIKDMEEVTGIVLKTSSGDEITGTVDLTNGTLTGVPITENGTYTVTISATNNEGKDITKTETIKIKNKIKIANIPDSWEPADDTNAENDWYAYKDATGVTATVNAPKLASGMTAIKYVAGTDTATYETLTAGSQWANAMTKDGSMWVWIPRYAYRITNGYHKSGADLDSSDATKGAGTIEIAFVKYDEDTDTNVFLDSSITETSGIADSDYDESNPSWILAPGFEFGDEHLDGFWFAKFEASNIDGYGSSSSTANNPDLTLQIKPNVTSWRSITSTNIFEVCLKLTSESNYSTYFNKVSNVDTHMTKNVEWGAVVYLAHSKYGLNGSEIAVKSNGYTTGQGAGNNNYNTTTGITASTTKNVYGIYDMSGGAYEYVAACLTGYTSELSSNTDSTYISKYIDVYSSYGITKYGDAVYETSNSSSGTNSWFKDYSYFVDSSGPVFGRGGRCDNGSYAGLFNFVRDNGVAYDTGGFRVVCAIK